MLLLGVGVEVVNGFPCFLYGVGDAHGYVVAILVKEGYSFSLFIGEKFRQRSFMGLLTP